MQNMQKTDITSGGGSAAAASDLTGGGKKKQGGASLLLLLLASLALLALYYRYYVKTPLTLQVLQTGVGALHPDMLREKQPIVVEDLVVDLRELACTVFRYYYVFPLRYRSGRKDGTVRTRGVFTMLSPYAKRRDEEEQEADEDDKAVVRARPLYVRDARTGKLRASEDEEDGVEFDLRPHQVLLLPPHWIAELYADSLYARNSMRWKTVEAYDLLHALFYPIGSVRDRAKGANV